MPRICEFNGIVIVMYRRENDPPHFHAIYGEYQALVGIDPIRVIKGRLPGRVRAVVLARAESHQDELSANWRRGQQRESFVRIAPPR